MKSLVKSRKRVRFSVKAAPNSNVYVAGTFNGWNPRKHKLNFSDGVYSAYGLLSPGKHEYKFVINDRWHCDPNCLEWTPDGHGAMNSIIVVK
ncbi:MAG: glycogen-binding domain-containing protein [bacterium]